MRLEYILNDAFIFMKLYSMSGSVIDIHSDNIYFSENIPYFQAQDVIINHGLTTSIVYSNISNASNNGIHFQSAYYTNPTNICIRTSYIAYRRL